MATNDSTRETFIHNSRDSFYRRPFGAVPTGENIILRLAVHKNFSPVDVTLRFWRDEKETLMKMKPVDKETYMTGAGFNAGPDTGAGEGPDGAFVDPYADGGVFLTGAGAPDGNYLIYQTQYNAGEKPGLVWYYFIIKNKKNEKLYYGNNPEMLGGPGCETKEPPWSYQITVYDAAFHVPDWLRHGVMYQIFPDRFYQKREYPLTQSRIEKKRNDYILHEDWDETPIFGPDPRTGEIMNNDFFGGNLAGIEAKLPYLKDLGISIIYLNPIFEAYSNHRYDTGDYMKIDALLGTRDDFTSLCDEARKLGIRIILDGVFNHTGSDSLYFNKDGHYNSIGAYQSSSSRYRNWYDFEKYPVKYKCWWGILTLPDINENDPGYKKFIVSDEDAVVKHWLRQGASGWRLDVVDELPGEFVKELREHIKQTDNDSVIIGEVWEDASNKVSYGKRREYLQGYELDSVMNYVLKNALIAFMLGNIDAARFNAEIWKITENYPKECYHSLMNIIGGHDVMRILTIMSEPPEGLTRRQKSLHKPSSYKHRLGMKRLKLLSLIQMTFPGAPCVYYGDEAGVTGFEDPFNRSSFPWAGMNREVFEWYKRIISLRNSNAFLRTGGFITVFAKGTAFAYVREIKGGADVFGAPAQDGFALVAINADKERDAFLDIDMSQWGVPALYDALEGCGHICNACAACGGASAGTDAAGILWSCTLQPGVPQPCTLLHYAPQPCAAYERGRLRLLLEPLGCRMYIFK